jgi:hypothetical protein
MSTAPPNDNVVTRPRIRDGEPCPATPYLVIPEALDDNGFRPQQGTGWICSQSLMLISAAGELETAPRPNVTYRLLALTENIGAAPVQNGFAEFWLAPKPPVTQIDPAPAFAYQRSPMTPDLSWTNLGVSTFALSSSIGGQGEIGWVLSPKSWTAADLGPCAVVRVFEPIQDGATVSQKSWEDRKLAFRAFSPNFAGTWTGTEKDATSGAVLGPVRLKISQEWEIADKGGVQAWTPTCFVDVQELPSLPPAGSSEAIWGTVVGALYYTIKRPSGSISMTFTFRADGSLEMHLLKNSGARTTTSLGLAQPGPPPPLPDKTLLSRVRQIIPQSWPKQRKADAEMIYKAIAALP